MEMDLIKNFLFIHLIEIEKKLLADNIEFIIGKKKDVVYIKFIQFDGYYGMSLEELEKLNAYREHSLFKVHRVSYKTIRPNYAYNTALMHFTRPAKNFNMQILQ